MNKSLNAKAAISGLICCALALQSAAAQDPSNRQLMSAGLKEQFNAADISSMMSEAAIQTQLAPYEGNDIATVLALTAGGGRFIISMFNCDDAATGEGCRGAAVFTAFSNAGLSFEELNQFNSTANVSKAFNVSAQNVVIFGTQIYFSGGITRDNFKFLTGLFLSDMQKYAQSQVESTSVSLKIEQDAQGKLDNVAQASGEAAEPSSLPAEYSISHAKSAAIANTWNVRFTPAAD